MQGNAFKVAILGGGPAGIAAALMIRHISDYDVYLFDANPKIGRKLSVTGSGRCNLTNLELDPERYYSTQPADLSPVFSRWSPADLRLFLDRIGIPTIATDDGWVYPQSFSAANVVQILNGNLTENNIHIIENTKVLSITLYENQFRLTVDNRKDSLVFDRILIATGSKAFPQLRADTGIVSELKKFGIHVAPFSPALSPVLLENEPHKLLSGIRLDVNLKLFRESSQIDESFGNIIFTDFGMNGPGCMNLSHRIQLLLENHPYFKVDFIPQEKSKIIEGIFNSKQDQNYPYRDIFLSILPMKLVDFFFNEWNIATDTKCSEINHQSFGSHIDQLRNFKMQIKGTKGFKESQACSGGVLLSEIDLRTMESLKIPGIYFAGEILDVVGPCGGYNLHWAFSSGLIAGEAMGKP